jgi:hypothetical protein
MIDKLEVEKYVAWYGEEHRDFIIHALNFKTFKQLDMNTIQVDLYLQNVFALATTNNEYGIGWNGVRYIKKEEEDVSEWEN